ncbi:MAG: EVE domain-containing protein [Actinomycetota bacterium]|nr:EVE domain-containing protein [Actinomycetota bacterium]
MNKEALLEWILQDAEKNEYEYALEAGAGNLETVLINDLVALTGMVEIDLPRSLPSDPSRAIPLLRGHFKDDVTLVSRVLNHLFPDRYLFYRVSKFEEEIFRSFDFFSSVVPEFGFPFLRVGRTGFDRYLQLNEALLSFFRRRYPRLEEPQIRIAWFLYEGLGRLFLEKSDYHRYWVMATREEYFEELDFQDDLDWSGRKDMQEGDLVFIYRTTPRSAITDLFEVQGEPRFDPWGEWDGFWVDLSRRCRIEDISFADMKEDPVLGNWGVVRKRFQGVVVEPVPHSIYNRLLEKIPKDIRDRHHLEPEPAAGQGFSSRFASEAHFEDQVIEPLLKRWGLGYQRQYRCRFKMGSQDLFGLVDFYVADGRGPITLFEDKFRILGERELRQATDQGKSYALMLGLPSFVVASPEGIWVYSLNRNEETLEEHVPLDELDVKGEGLRDKLLKMRSR